jgi:hypothetical protein
MRKALLLILMFFVFGCTSQVKPDEKPAPADTDSKAKATTPAPSGGDTCKTDADCPEGAKCIEVEIPIEAVGKRAIYHRCSGGEGQPTPPAPEPAPEPVPEPEPAPEPKP